MNNSDKPIEMLFEKAENYGKTTVELFKLNAIDKTADIGSTIAVQLVIIVILAMFSLSINVGVALWIGELLGKSYYGFFVVAGFYAIAALLVYIFRIQCIKLPIQNNIIKKILQQKSL